jgi:pyrimidine operon attenuation protein/uracil phosphoribosyltransferase
MQSEIPNAQHIIDAEGIQRAIQRIARDIQQRNDGLHMTTLIGIQPNGVPLAQRLAANMAEFEGQQVPVGMLDVSFYRREPQRQPLLLAPSRTLTPVDLTGYTVILVDTVLHTGRTVRAALDALMDLGSPARVQLAVLIDRGQHEMPVRADFVGKRVPAAPDEQIQVFLSEEDTADDNKVLILNARPDASDMYVR